MLKMLTVRVSSIAKATHIFFSQNISVLMIKVLTIRYLTTSLVLEYWAQSFYCPPEDTLDSWLSEYAS